jgi:hypothetical protein
VTLETSHPRGGTPEGTPKGNGPRIAAPGVSALNARRPAIGDELILRLIVIACDDEFYLRLRQIAGACQWRIARASSVEEAALLIADAIPTPLVVYEGRPDDREWRFALRRLHELPDQPCVLLASSVADDNLLREVVRNHGYDVLPKSAPRENLIRCLDFAWFWALSTGRGRT